jgi:predicted phage-related endonuclease
MTLLELPDLIQGTDEWHDQRRGIVTASVVGKLLTTKGAVANNDTSRAVVATLVAERITGWTDPVYVSDDMLRGTNDEPFAVAAYSEWSGQEVATTGFMVRDDWGFEIGYSPDGLVGDDGLIEVKSRRPKKHLTTILDDEVPSENFAQLQCGLLVSGRAWIDYVSFCGGMPLYVKRVEPSQAWFDSILEAVAAFEEAAAQMVADYRAATAGMPITERVVELEMVI